MSSAVNERDVNLVFRWLCLYGLGMNPRTAPGIIARREKKIIAELLEEVPANKLCDAIRFGMPNVWPFSEDGRSFDAKDLRRYLVKALGEAAKRERRSEIPLNIQKMQAAR